MRVLFLLLLVFSAFEISGKNSDSIIQIVSSPNLSFEKKYQQIDNISELEYKDRIIILKVLLKEAKKENNKAAIVRIYSLIGQNYLFDNYVNSGKVYLDSASVFVNKITNNQSLGTYYYALGDYYNILMDEAKAHKNYYIAIEAFENAKTNQKELIFLFHNIAFSYIQKKDMRSLEMIIDKMRSAVLEIDDNAANILYYRVLAFYYSCLYEKEKTNKLFLDSAIIYDGQIIELFEKNPDLKSYANEIAYSYMNLANNFFEQGSTDFSTTNALATKAIGLANPQDTAMIVNSYWVKGFSLYNMNELEASQKVLTEQLHIMNKWSASENLSMYTRLYRILGDIAISKGDYKTALEYERKRAEFTAKVHDEQKYKAIKELETKYEVDKKEQQIMQQKRINILIAGISIMIILAGLFIIRWLRLGKNLARKQLKIVNLEKQDAENRIQQQEDQLTRSVLEKKEALLENYIKTNEMTTAIRKLKAELESLKKDYDSIQQETKEIIKQEQDKAVIHVRTLISEKLKSYPEDQQRYLDKLEMVGNNSVFLLKSKELTDTNIQYCICLAIGMKGKHIMTCYNIVSQTLRKNRSDIKVSLGLDKDDDLDIFLIDLILLNQHTDF